MVSFSFCMEYGHVSYLCMEDAGNADGTADAIKTERGNLLVVTVL